ncbi:MAG: hypothetical protein RLY71_1798 [Pseudomonadota bacterium]|jgi:hypothetical protein
MALILVKNQGLTDAQTSTTTSNICEPTAAANGAQLFMTGNWFASSSANTGSSWAYISPFTAFPATAGGFCCDQIVLFNPKHKIWLWLLQYSQDAAGENIFRLAISREASFGSWYWWDFQSKMGLAAWAGNWFDYPDMAFTTDQLFVSFNMFKGNAWQRAIVFRFPLAALASGSALNYQRWNTTSNGSIRLCRGPGNVMYMGSHNTASQLRLFNWPDISLNIGWNDVNVRPWLAGAYSSIGPSGLNWLGRTDQRITGAWMGAGMAGFMWTANRDANHSLPYIRVARIDVTSKALIDEPDIWSNTAAWAYPAAAANSNGAIGITAFYGGGTYHPSHVVGIKTATGWETKLTRSSTHSPVQQSWGDYISCTPHYPNTTQWVACGYTLQGGTDRKHIEPRYVQFSA